MAKTKIRGKGEGSLYQRSSDGMWIARVELPLGIDGRRHKQRARKAKKEAQAELQKLIAELAEHGDIAPTRTMTLEKWLTHWLDEIAPLRVRPKTLEGYASSLRTHVIPAIGPKPLAKLTPSDIRELHKRMRVTPADPRIRRLPQEEWPEGVRMLSSTTILLAHNALSVALRDAVREEIGLRSNPCEKVVKPARAVTAARALTVEEAVKVIAYCTTIPDGPLWTAYLLTASRRGELLGLETDRVADVLDVSWQTQRISDISKARADYEYRPIKGTLYLTRPKSAAGWRLIPADWGMLRDTMALALQSAVGGFVFTEWKKTDGGWENTGRPWDPDRATRRWKEVVREAGIEGDVVVHDLRHTTVDLLYEAGVDERVIKDIVGHSTVTMTRRYRTEGRRNMPELTAAMAKMGKLLSDKGSASTGG